MNRRHTSWCTCGECGGFVQAIVAVVCLMAIAVVGGVLFGLVLHACATR